MKTTESTNVAIIGAGFGGMAMAHALERAGVHDFVLLERAAAAGGVWRDNTYPGAACDVPSHLYSFSFGPDFPWSRKYATGPEIHRYQQQCLAALGSGSRLRLGWNVKRAMYDDATAQWVLTAADGREVHARTVVSACGQLTVPRWPRVDQLARFAGIVMHSAQWRNDVDLARRHVVVIGTGASAIQLVPQLAGRVKALTVLQRSAPYVLRKPDRAYGRFERALLRRVPAISRVSRLLKFLRHEALGLAMHHVSPVLRLYELYYRNLLWRKVRDPTKRALLRPRDAIGCKRILLANDYLETLARPDVRLVHGALRSCTTDGIITQDGQAIPCDALIFCTGFDATSFLDTFEVVGRRGQQLAQHWAGGARAYRGIATHGFPNFFMLYGPGTNLGHNSILHILESQAHHVVQLITRALTRRATIEVRAEAERQDIEWLTTRLGRSVWASGCRNWYQTPAGDIVNNWPGLAVSYRWRTRRVNWADYAVEEAGA